MNSIVLKAKCIKCSFKKDDYRIFSWSPITKVDEVKTSTYYTFSTKGNDPYIDEGKEYEIEIEEISYDPKWGGTYKLLSVPSMNELDLDNMTLEQKKEILLDCTSSEKIANNILSAYPNFIELILTEGKEAIDTKNIYGVGEAYLNSYARTILEKYKYYGIIIKYKEYKLDVKDCKELIATYIDDNGIATNFQSNPYKVLIQTLGRSFAKADAMLMELRPELKESEQRCSFLILDVLQRNEADGNTRLNGNDLYYYIETEYNVPELMPLIVETAKTNELFYYDEESMDLSIATTYYAECRIVDFVMNKIKNSTKLDIDWSAYTTVDDFSMSAKQSKALELFCENNFMILGGVSGGGKTTSLKGIVKLIEDNGMTYSLLAPTGKASMRMAEAVHRASSTIHRKCLKVGEIDSDVIIVDETSMVDLWTFSMLIENISNENARIVLVGDNNQLMPVGIGCVFNDLINSGKIPMIILDEVFRYKTNGGLFVATNIRQGNRFFDDTEMVKHNGNEYTVCDNYKFIETNDIFDEIVSNYNKLIEKGIKPKDILCLSPMNVGSEGTYIINNTIQSEVNPPKPNEKVLTREIGKVKITFRVGDMVINKRNDYKAMPLDSYIEIQNSCGGLTSEDVPLTSVFNGQCGVVRQIEDRYMVIQFDEELIVFEGIEIDNLLLAYCISVHSSQGSESPYVINVVSDKHTRMLNRNLLYVADTRGKKMTIDIGSTKAFNNALLVDGTQERLTWLKELVENWQ